MGTLQNMLLLLPFKSNLLCTHYNFTDVLDSMYCMFDFLHEFGLEVFCRPFIWQKWPIAINFGNNLLRNTVSELYSNVPLFRAYSGVFLQNFFASPITVSRGPIVAFLSPIVTFSGPIAAFSEKVVFP